MFERIDIGIKTFLRDEQLFKALKGIDDYFFGARAIVVDDGKATVEKYNAYAVLERLGHATSLLPFDSGFGKKSNRIVELSTRPYLLIASDDFEFDKQAASGLTDMQKVLDNCPDVDIASGRVNHSPYEFYLEISDFGEGVYIKEHPVTKQIYDGFEILFPWIIDCDLTVNYSLIRREVFKKVKWDDDVKIGNGEHGSFFYDCKLAGLKTVCVPSANINEQKIRNSPEYKQYRNRANSPERSCFDKRNIVEYILGDGRVDYRR